MLDFKYMIKRVLFDRKRINPARRVVLGFVFIILIGALLLMLPISARNGQSTDFFTCLFTATSTTCVTGLTLVDTYTHWSFFGHVIMICLIQIGGLGFMTILSLAFFMSHRRIGLRDRMMMMQSFNLDSMEGVVKLVRHVLTATLVIEGIGAMILAGCFIPQMGLARGIWSGIFHSISAFCNAGFDILGKYDPNSSLIHYQRNAVVLLTISALIIIGGLGFFVWEDIYQQKNRRRLSLHSKMVLIITPALLFIGTAGFFIMEMNNPETLGGLPWWDKLLGAFFQSTTARTAGFDAMGQAGITEQSKLLTTILMFIGGSSGSTAGGVKTVTVGILVLTTISTMQSKRDLVIFGWRIGHTQILYAVSLIILGAFLVVCGGLFISLLDNVSLYDAIYETASAYGTVGLTSGVTENASTLSRTILILYMFFGRVGIMTVSISVLLRGRQGDGIKYPGGSVLIG